MSIKIPSLSEMMEAGVHFGHVAKYWQPKMAPYIYLRRDKIHVLNLEKTKEALERILPEISQKIASGKSMVLVGTKKQIRSVIKEIGQETDTPYVDIRWLGGTLTNFEVMHASIKRMREIEALLSSPDIAKYTKKERLTLTRQLARMEEKFGGLKNLNSLPDTLFIVDCHFEKNAVKEAKVLGLEIIALIDTNSDPTDIDYIIPANDDAKKSVGLIMNLVKQAILEGRNKPKNSSEEKKVIT